MLKLVVKLLLFALLIGGIDASDVCRSQKTGNTLL